VAVNNDQRAPSIRLLDPNHDIRASPRPGSLLRRHLRRLLGDHRARLRRSRRPHPTRQFALPAMAYCGFA
jgi:hypothetical protein